MNSPLTTVLVVGKFASGKSYLCQLLDAIMTRDGIPHFIQSDRIAFEDAVLRDVAQASHIDGVGWQGTSSILVENGMPGQRKFRATDGAIFNSAHEEMIASIPRNRKKGVAIVEYALGPRINFGPGKATLDQDGATLLSWMKKYGVTDHVMVVEVEANFPSRFSRNAARGDSVPEEAFLTFAGDEGEIHSVEHELGDRYVLIENTAHDIASFGLQVESLYNGSIRPWAQRDLGERVREGLSGMFPSWTRRL